ncbi:MAG TPA: hypothetical protein VJN44_11795 [Roseateles sp.]|nr:hypothetical protein [Roseateles sp.]
MRGEEAWSVNREPMDKNRMEGAAEQGERAHGVRPTTVARTVLRFRGLALPQRHQQASSAVRTDGGGKPRICLDCEVGAPKHQPLSAQTGR